MYTHKPSAPSTIARSVAAAIWPDVHSQKRVAPGVYSFSCSGHGGMIAVIGAADLPENAIAAARAAGLVYTVLERTDERRIRRYCSANGYSASQLRDLAQRYPIAYRIVEVWIGEEDCDWSTIALASEAIRQGCIAAGFAASALTYDAVHAVAAEYQPAYVQALETAN